MNVPKYEEKLMLKAVSLIFIAGFLLLCNANVLTADAISKRHIVTIGDEKINFEQLEKAFGKNIQLRERKIWEVSKDTLDNFIDMFVNYRLKVLDAKSRGLDQDKVVVDEVKNNRRSLAESFYFDRNIIQPEITRMLEGRNFEYKMAMIMTTPRATGTDRDTTGAYNVITDALNRLKAGESFSEVARETSFDKESAANGGVIPNYITTGRLQRQIEVAIYNTKVGEIYPEVIRTHFGYFIIKVLDRQPRELVKLRHILLTYAQDQDTTEIHKKADNLISRLKKGESFEKLATEYSEDESSRIQGGYLGEYYSRSTGLETAGTALLREFEEAAFSLKDGQFSDKVITDFGVHIIYREDTKKPDLKIEEIDIRSLYRRSYFAEDKKDEMERIRKNMGFQIFDDNLNEFLSYLDTTATNIKGDWTNNIPESTKNKNLYTLDNKITTIKDFIDIVNADVAMKGIATNKAGILEGIQRITEPIAFDKATANLDKESQEFYELLTEFRDGILLFKVEATEIWDRLRFDSTAALKYYEERKANFQTETMYDISEIYLMSDETAQEVYGHLNAGKEFDYLAEINTLRAGYRAKKGHWGKLAPSKSSLAAKVAEFNPKKGDIIKPFEFESGWSIVKVNEVYPTRQMTFEEAIPVFAPQFQEYQQKRLNDEWINNLRNKFDIKINEKDLEKSLKERKNQFTEK